MNQQRNIRDRVKKAFEQQALDANTREDLRAARQRALQQAPASTLTGWRPTVALACLLLVVIGLVVYRVDDTTELPQMTADELAVITSEDELELFEELEFYIWLEDDENA